MTAAATCTMDLRTLFNGLAANAPAREVTDITQDSRTAVRDGLFLACRGTRQHGLEFVGDALRAGVGAIAWEPADALPAPALPAHVTGLAVPRLGEQLGEVANRFFASPSAALAITGITGTNGKTTTAWLVMQALSQLGVTPGYLGTLGYGVGGQVKPAVLTTPDCISLHRQLRELKDAGATHAIVEVSSHALDQQRIAGVRFATVAFTNLTRDHLDYHPDLAAYGAAKARLFALGAATAVINLDDAFGRELASRLPADTRLIGTTLQATAPAALQGTVTMLGAEGLVLDIRCQGGEAQVHTRLWGRFNAENLLLAAGILLAGGWPLDRIASALGTCTAPPGRLQRVAGQPGQPAVLVDFAHTPDALAKALAAVREHCTGRVWCVFGCGGDRDRGKRAPMGAAAVNGADCVIVTDDNPRFEDPQQIIADILAGAPSLDRLQVVPGRGAAIERAIRLAAGDDVVLIAGKGHESFQIIGATRTPFSDVEVAEAALRIAAAGLPGHRDA